MHYEDIIGRIEEVAPGGLDEGGARRALDATLATLAECIPAETASNLAAQLPVELKTPLASAGEPAQAQALSLNDFLARVADREELSPSEALQQVRAVFSGLAYAVTGHELHDVRAQLPEEFATLFAKPAAAGWPDVRHSRPHA